MSNNTGFADMGPRQPKRAGINSSAAAVDVVSAVSGKKIRITGMCIQVSAAGTVTFASDGSGDPTELGRWTAVAGELLMETGYNPDGWFETVAGEAFQLGNAGELTLSGFVTYIEV